MATKLINTQSPRKSNTNNTDQEYYNLYYSADDNCVFTPSSKAMAGALNADTVFKIVTNRLTNDVLFTTTKAYKKGNKTFTNFNVKVMPTAGEHKDKYVSAGFINYYDNSLTEASSEVERTEAIKHLREELSTLTPEQVSKHITTDDATQIVSVL